MSLLKIRCCLKMAAAPIFALMAFLSSVYVNPLAGICGGSAGPIPLNMVTMYALMSVFHVGPWLELFAKSQNNEVPNGG